MAELPKSWGLKTRRSGSKVDVIGKDDNGQEYKVRTCEGEVTEADVQAIRDCDREAYAGMSRQQAAREAVNRIMAPGLSAKADNERRLSEDFTACAEEIVSLSTSGGRATSPASFDVGLSMGMTSSYARGERYWKEIAEWKRRGMPLGDN